jgi:hypothetical protein
VFMAQPLAKKLYRNDTTDPEFVEVCLAGEVELVWLPIGRA